MPRHDAEIAVVDVLVVIVLDLHDLVARAEGPAEALDADLARRVQRVLQLDIERASTEAAAVHRAEHLDVAYRVKPEAFRDPVLHDRQQLSNTLFRVRRVDEIEIAAFDRGEIGHQAWLIRCALTMIRLSAACRKTSVKRTTGTEADAMISPRTCPGPTEGS